MTTQKPEKALLQAIMDNFPGSLFVSDDQGNLISQNRVRESLFGPISGPKALRHVLDPVYEQDRHHMAAKLKEVLETGNAETEVRVITAGGKMLHRLLRMTRVELNGDKQILYTAIDVSHKKQVEEELRKVEERFSKAFMATPLAISISRCTDRKFLEVNEAFVNVTGYSRDDVIGRSAVEVGLWCDPGDSDTMAEALCSGGSLRNHVCRFRTRQGAVLTCLMSAEIVEIGHEPCFLVILADVTERNRTEAELRRRNRELTLLNRIMIATAEKDPQSVLELACREIALAFDLPLGAAFKINEARNTATVVAEYALPGVTSILGRKVPLSANPLVDVLVRLRRPMVSENAREDPRLVSVLQLLTQRGTASVMVLPLIMDEEIIGCLSFGSLQPRAFSEEELDLAWNVAGQVAAALARARLSAKRIRAEEALRESEERYRRLVEDAPLGIISVDRYGNITSVNSRMVSIAGAPSADATRSVNMFTFPVLIQAGISRDVRRCLVSGESGVFETFYRSPWGKESYLRYHLTPVRDQRGEIIGVQSIVEDFTETRRLQDQLAQAQKMEAMGTLAGGIAHDFNNILSGILGYAELARLYAGGDAKIRENLQECIKAAQRAKELVGQIVTFSRQTRREPKPVDVGSVIKEITLFLRATLPSTIQISVTTQPGSSLIEVDPTDLYQILMNLCTNAKDAMEENGGVLELSCSNIEVGDVALPGSPELPPGPFVQLRVRDTGQGILPEVLPKIFDLYYTTKPVGKGTGMGLAIVKDLAKAAGGTVTVTTEPGKGSTFDVYLPSVAAAAPSTGEPVVEPAPAGGGARILFVDDETAITEIGQRMLEYLGYNVIPATDGQEAFKLFRESPNWFDMVITDMTMPGMTGDKLAEQILRIRPDIPIILCTGFSDHITERKAAALGIRKFLTKPILMEDLVSNIRQLLDKRV